MYKYVYKKCKNKIDEGVGREYLKRRVDFSRESQVIS